MAMHWPTQLPHDIQFENVFDLAQTFESHCAKIYDHATLHPNDVASADYVMQLVSQAYRVVHSLHMQKKALNFLDLNTATADLKKHALKERETRNVETTDHVKVIETPELPVNDQQGEPLHDTLADLINGDFEKDDDDEEEDSDWEESEEETDDEYYEYHEGSDTDSELEVLGTVAEVEHDEETITKPQMSQAEEKSDISEQNEKEETKDVSSPPKVPNLQDQAMHDRITAALQQMGLSQEDPEPKPKPKPEPETVVLEPIQTQSSTSLSDSSSTRDTQSEATAVQTNSNQDVPHLQPSTIISPDKAAQKPSFDTVRLRRKLSEGSVPTDIPRRLKTVCYKYVRRAMVPIRGKAQ